MKILIIRHAEPDYEHDTLTEKGWREAEYLSEYMKNIPVDAYYVSPLGRAQDTASLTLKKVNSNATTLEWLKEFHSPIKRPDKNGQYANTWDWLPEDWTKEDLYFDKDKWYTTDIMSNDNVKKTYDWVCDGLDEILLKHGYKRHKNYYEAIEANNDTIVFFCHFGLEGVLLSHLLNISPMCIWHGTVALPSSITTLATEERRENIAYFRMSSFGATPHLYVNNEPESFHARFCECYKNENERHD